MVFKSLIRIGVFYTPPSGATLGFTPTTNRKGRFEDRWVHLVVDSSSPCIFTQGIQNIELPIRHGEGRIEADQETVLQPLLTQSHPRFPCNMRTKKGEQQNVIQKIPMVLLGNR